MVIFLMTKKVLKMKTKMKLCSGCETEQYIWKTIGRDRYCKSCAATITPTKKIPAKSSKKASEDETYSKLRRDFLTLHPTCRAQLPTCTAQATDVHHKKGRGKYYLITPTWLPVCRTCHMWIETHPIEAKELGFSEDRK